MSLIYHYCKPEAFLQIIEKKKLWLSATNNMNDFAEDKWVEQALCYVLKRIVTDENREWCEKVWLLFTAANRPKFVACFSTDDDSLSQWRAYAQDGEGVAIGFDESWLGLRRGEWEQDFKGHFRIKLSEIDYIDTHELESNIKVLLDRYYSPDEYERSDMLMMLNDKLNELGMTVKNPAFSEEKEKRIIYSSRFTLEDDVWEKTHSELVGELHYRIAGGFLTSYYELALSNEQAISEVVLGPKNKFTQYDILTFLGIHKFSHTHVRNSSATYR